MITAVVYAESGGTFKTTMTANLAVALSRMDLDVLVLDLDPQTGNLTSLFDVGEDRSDPNADNLVKHILEMPDGDFASLIETSPEGVDIVPSHDMLSDFTSNLEQKITYETGVKDVSREEYPRYELLYRLLWEREQVNEQYDVVLIDPNARAEDLLYNAMYALRTLVARSNRLARAASAWTASKRWSGTWRPNSTSASACRVWSPVGWGRRTPTSSTATGSRPRTRSRHRSRSAPERA